MTTASMATEHQHWWRFFGPWPLQPLALAGIGGILSLTLGLEEGRWFDQGVNFVAAFAVALSIWSILSLAARWAPRVTARPVGYVILFVILAVVMTVIREAAGVIPGSTLAEVRIPSVMGATTLALIVIQGILGSAQARLRRENERATWALDEVRAQQEALLRADEAVRRQVAIVLHDQVQAGLVSACLRLQTARSADGSVEEQQRAIGEVIRQLEQLRALDLRRAVRSLSPNLRDVDMQTSLEELAEAWAPSMDVEIRIEGQVPKDRDLRLGAYRIVEQGLLNSATHGRARTCTVRLLVDDRLILDIDDDGVGMPDDPKPGLGSALMTTWCRTLHGSWAWKESPLGGARLSAELPLESVPSA